MTQSRYARVAARKQERGSDGLLAQIIIEDMELYDLLDRGAEFSDHCSVDAGGHKAV